MSNRVEELESQVAELQAAVDGLTEELVETRERLRALEDGAADRGGRSESVTSGGGEAQTNGSADETDHDPDPEPDAAAEADAPDGGPAETDADAESDDGSSSDSDDIIVA